MTDLVRIAQGIKALPAGDLLGRVSKVVGLLVESRGPEASVGEQVLIRMADRTITAEVVGFQDKQVLLMPVENTDGIRPGLMVEATGHLPDLPVSDDLLGRIIDPLGRPLDGGPPIRATAHVPIHGQPPNPMSRRRIGEVLSTGVRALDGLLTLGKGQRVGIFSGSGVGKSTLLGMVARNTSASLQQRSCRRSLRRPHAVDVGLSPKSQEYMRVRKAREDMSGQCARRQTAWKTISPLG